MNEEEKYDKIERYLNGQLSEAELNDFEALMAVEEALRNEVKLHQDLEQTLKGEQIHQLRDTLKEVNQKWEDPEPKKEAKVRSFPLRNWLAIAATIALLIITYFTFQSASKTNQELFADNFDLYPMVLNQRSGTVVDSILNEAIDAYEQSDFAEASQQFQRLQNLDKNNSVYPFYKSLSLLANQEAQKAIPILTQLANENSKLAEQSRWYLALAYLQIDDLSNAKGELKRIQKGQYQFVQAQTLLDSN